MKKGWEIKKLGDVCELINGLWTGKKEPFIDVAVYSMSNFTKDCRLDKSKPTRSITASLNQYEKRKLKFGDILLEKSGGGPNQAVGRVAFFDIDNNLNNTFSNFTARVRIKKNEQLIPEYLYTYLKYLYITGITEKYQKNSTNIRNLQTKEYLTEFIPIPPLPDQKQIVTLLDKAFAAIDQAQANIEKNIENAKELFQSKLNEIFSQPARPSGGKGEGDAQSLSKGWEEKSLGEVCEYDKTKYNNSNLPYVGLEHIESNSGKFIGKLNPFQVKSSTFKFDERHVLYGRLRPYLNKVLVPNFNGHCSTEIFPILTSNLLDRGFLFYWLLSPKTVSKIDATWTGARMPRANMNEVIKFKLFIPKIETQKQIVNQLNDLKTATNEIETHYQQKLANLKDLKKSILQKAFLGALTVSNLDLKDLKMA